MRKKSADRITSMYEIEDKHKGWKGEPIGEWGTELGTERVRENNVCGIGKDERAESRRRWVGMSLVGVLDENVERYGEGDQEIGMTGMIDVTTGRGKEFVKTRRGIEYENADLP